MQKYQRLQLRSLEFGKTTTVKRKDKNGIIHYNDCNYTFFIYYRLFITYLIDIRIFCYNVIKRLTNINNLLKCFYSFLSTKHIYTYKFVPPNTSPI